MRLGVNALRLSGQRLGIGRYIEYMLKYWNQMLTPSDTVTVYVREPWDKHTLQLSDAFQVRVLPSRWWGVFWEHFVLARHADPMDVLFCPSYTVPLNFTGRCVVATHSVNEAQPGAHNWWYHLTYRQRNRLCARKANAVIVPSQSVKKHVEDLYGVPASKIDIVPEGAGDAFQPIQDEALVRETRRKYLGTDDPYILFVGKMSPRRNIPALLEAFSVLKKEDHIPHKLLLFGPNVYRLPLEPLIAKLGIEKSVVQTDGKLERHQDIVPVYWGADLFVHASTYEGFSITIAEALACGVPVITVDRGAIKEFTEGAVFMVPEPTAEHLTAAIRRVLSDDALRSTLRAAGPIRAKRYRYEETARATLDVLRRVAER